MDTGFGHWLAGFIDGEGCFLIVRTRTYHQCRFSLKVRDDDIAVIEEIQQRTQIGRVKANRSRNTSNPQVEWIIDTKPDCLELVNILDKFPLRAKKARDYQIWREAV